MPLVLLRSTKDNQAYSFDMSDDAYNEYVALSSGRAKTWDGKFMLALLLRTTLVKTSPLRNLPEDIYELVEDSVFHTQRMVTNYLMNKISYYESLEKSEFIKDLLTFIDKETIKSFLIQYADNN